MTTAHIDADGDTAMDAPPVGSPAPEDVPGAFPQVGAVFSATSKGKGKARLDDAEAKRAVREGLPWCVRRKDPSG